MCVRFNLNGKAETARAEADTPLVWVISDELGLTGTTDNTTTTSVARSSRPPLSPPAAC